MHKVIPLSIQQMLDCSRTNYGCEGGDTCNGLRWMVDQNIKLGTRAQYPSRPNESGECKNQSFDDGVAIANYTCNEYVLEQMHFYRPL